MNVLTIREVSGLDSVVVNGHTAKVFEEEQTGKFELLLLGVGLDSMQVQFFQQEVAQSTPFRLSSRFSGMPEEVELPAGVARRGGYTEVVNEFK